MVERCVGVRVDEASGCRPTEGGVTVSLSAFTAAAAVDVEVENRERPLGVR